jgi:hypothetical protein
VLVFFFDEAHLLFEDAPAPLIEKIEQVVRLIRSKGVGVYFVTQNPLDVPDTVLAQLGNRVQHALRAFTPRDQKAVKTAAETLRANPAVDTVKAISELAVGEALVSCLDAKGIPTMVERAWIMPPGTRIGAITDAERRSVMQSSPVAGRYDQPIDRESAYETLKSRTASRSAAPSPAQHPGTAPTAQVPGAGTPTPSAGGTLAEVGGALSGMLFGTTGPRGAHHEGMLESAAKSAARSMGSGLGRQILRGVLGSMMGGKR